MTDNQITCDVVSKNECKNIVFYFNHIAINKYTYSHFEYDHFQPIILDKHIPVC